MSIINYSITFPLRKRKTISSEMLKENATMIPAIDSFILYHIIVYTLIYYVNHIHKAHINAANLLQYTCTYPN